MKRILGYVILAVIFTLPVGRVDAQHLYAFTRADSLRGGLREERTCFDVKYYDLRLEIIPEHRAIKGRVTIFFELIKRSKAIQIDLFRNMVIDRIESGSDSLKYTREEDAVFIDVSKFAPGKHDITVHYSGVPTTGKMLPWDGGFLWTSDKDGNPWITVACEGLGASAWWPNKDHLSDEPDSLFLECTVPSGLQCISNGTPLGHTDSADGKTSWKWKVHYPINNYNVTLNIGRYAHFSDTFHCQNGDVLPLDYYVMPYNLEKAKKHFIQVHDVLAAFEHYLGPYPYIRDGYALVETPYLGMEHQGAIAYGNKYLRGYLGGRQPSDMDQDYIILHETGHEYFGNWVSCSDHAEMWIHESFTTYLEALFVEYHMGREDALRYLQYQRPFIRNNSPMLGPSGVNYQDWGSSDIYYKGAWMLQTLREGFDNDSLWWATLRGIVKDLGNQTITSDELTNYINNKSHRNWDLFFKQYLERAKIPDLLWRSLPNGQVQLKWSSAVDGFDLPLHWSTDGKVVRVDPNTDTWISVGADEWSDQVPGELMGRYLITVKRSE